MSTHNPIVGEWIYLAQMDYESAVILAERFRPFIEGVCYHCQQSTEKIFKAYIVANGGTPAKTHDLEILLELCKRHLFDFDNYIDSCDTLTMYASDTRYPPRMALTEQHMNEALKYASEILEFTKEKLKAMGYEHTA